MSSKTSESSMSSEILASCTCGQVMFRSEDKPQLALICHCQDCRYATSREFSEIAFFLKKSVKLEGELVSNTYTAESGSKTWRDFCKLCKTPMYDRSEGFPALIGVFTVNLKPCITKKPKLHVWASSALNQSTIPRL